MGTNGRYYRPGRSAERLNTEGKRREMRVVCVCVEMSCSGSVHMTDPHDREFWLLKAPSVLQSRLRFLSRHLKLLIKYW